MKRLLFTTALFVLFTNFLTAQPSRTRNVGEFTRISIGQTHHVQLIQTDRCEIIIPDGVSDIFEVSNNGTLRIFGPDTRSNQKREEEPIIILFQSLNNLVVSGIARVSSEDKIVGDELKLELSGSSHTRLILAYDDILLRASGASHLNLKLLEQANVLSVQSSGASQLNLSGAAQTLSIQGSGAVSISAEQLETQEINVVLSGASHARLNTKTATGSISGASTLHFNPEADNQVSYRTPRVTPRVVSVRQSSTQNSTNIEIDDRVEDINDWFEDNGINIKIHTPGQRKSKTSKRFSPSYGFFDFGFSGYGQDFFRNTLPEGYENMQLKQNTSFAINLNILQYGVRLGGRNSPVGIGVGMGIGWNIYKFLDESIIPSRDRDLGIFVVEPYDGPEDRKYRRSKLQSSWLKVPLYLNYQKNEFFATAGVVGNVRLGASSVQVYNFNGRKRDRTRDNFYLNAFRVDTELRFGYKNVGFFATYSLTEMFLKDKGPELKPFSFGITLGV
ncbi:MAG: DUF2807 domain-containing protein [Bacteroidales bacterium]|nr:DUF2807 domain-containing protein [Bacteroidales bacterium]